MSKYKHLTLAERVLIQDKLNNGFSVKKIAKELGRPTTTITRELQKNSIPMKRAVMEDRSTTVQKGPNVMQSAFVWSVLNKIIPNVHYVLYVTAIARNTRRKSARNLKRHLMCAILAQTDTSAPWKRCFTWLTRRMKSQKGC